MTAHSSVYFRNRVFAVAGGGSGIGLATVKQLITLGARVSVADYRLSSSLESDVGGNTGNLILAKVDVTKADQVEKWMQDTIREWGRLDGAANLAGIVAKDHNTGTILTTEDQEWLRVFDVNIHGTKNCVREQVKYIGQGYLTSFEGEKLEVGKCNPKAEGGSIVNTGSTLAVAGTAGTAAYAASKHAVLGLTRCVAKEVGPKGTRVNCINPYVSSTTYESSVLKVNMMSRGPVATPLMATVGEQERITGKQDNVGYGALTLRRIGEPEELADAFIFLLSDKSTFVTGAYFAIDGGLTI